jgi:hypothetical protein
MKEDEKRYWELVTVFAKDYAHLWQENNWKYNSSAVGVILASFYIYKCMWITNFCFGVAFLKFRNTDILSHTTLHFGDYSALASTH